MTNCVSLSLACGSSCKKSHIRLCGISHPWLQLRQSEISYLLSSTLEISLLLSLTSSYSALLFLLKNPIFMICLGLVIRDFFQSYQQFSSSSLGRFSCVNFSKFISSFKGTLIILLWSCTVMMFPLGRFLIIASNYMFFFAKDAC